MPYIIKPTNNLEVDMSNSDKVVKPDGTILHGNAATLYIASQNGGMDQHIDKLVEKAAIAAAKAAVAEHKKSQQRPTLKVVNGGKK